jgi:hypothetical protein
MQNLFVIAAGREFLAERFMGLSEQSGHHHCGKTDGPLLGAARLIFFDWKLQPMTTDTRP